ncbi:glycosyltransferase family 2 protein [Streptococcus sanguinis]|uniref:Alpha-L-Rha alpha-1,3-L-rhamnosyltransferase n=1 Tax=Streptococcus sanguinis SK115 TaxID=888810 RepID=F0I5Z8_STRSA|nr:glycosyltransferase family 2 protein [Streptococcus sanguinis]EGD32857.1 alpha-L-Rha alpha-1,3-L-rhamnosyltransferase [Streptococcus sanguinis SK115]MBZ2053725.1 glycosyltransferase family 2 protein [Streptococcus sanguinis]MCY7013027.1 glycosyltransferase family 2 protein [Streptococcus sanguinis]MCY7032527.1 glycosyltransferase family 2 protein [Streptococcus sanguinis]
MKVTILLSTYNGEQFLAEQIKSIQEQTYKGWQLLIRDDGSTDGTRAVIEDFCRKDDRIAFINRGNPQNLGVIQSFHSLLQYQDSDFYLFSDQDDVWLPDKIAMQLAEADKYDSSQPLLVYTDLKVVDQELQVVHESMIRTQSDHANTELVQELTENTVTGGVSMINRALAQLWTGKEEHELLMHDWYLGLLAAAFGNLVYIDKPGELYRQHSNNVLGARTLRKRVKNWVRPHVLFTKYWKLIKDSQTQARNLLVLPLTAENRELIENFVTIMEVSTKERWRRIRQYGYRKNRTFHTLVFTSLILTKFAYKE